MATGAGGRRTLQQPCRFIKYTRRGEAADTRHLLQKEARLWQLQALHLACLPPPSNSRVSRLLMMHQELVRRQTISEKPLQHFKWPRGMHAHGRAHTRVIQQATLARASSAPPTWSLKPASSPATARASPRPRSRQRAGSAALWSHVPSSQRPRKLAPSANTISPTPWRLPAFQSPWYLWLVIATCWVQDYTYWAEPAKGRLRPLHGPPQAWKSPAVMTLRQAGAWKWALLAAAAATHSTYANASKAASCTRTQSRHPQNRTCRRRRKPSSRSPPSCRPPRPQHICRRWQTRSAPGRRGRLRPRSQHSGRRWSSGRPLRTRGDQFCFVMGYDSLRVLKGRPQLCGGMSWIGA
jgi:hypothetical protein